MFFPKCRSSMLGQGRLRLSWDLRFEPPKQTALYTSSDAHSVLIIDSSLFLLKSDRLAKKV
jgi:hypothetical protein